MGKNIPEMSIVLTRVQNNFTNKLEGRKQEKQRRNGTHRDCSGRTSITLRERLSKEG